MKKIFILLPNKDQFITSNSGSASIWVKDFNKYSKYKDNISIFGNTKNTDQIIDKTNYVNLQIPDKKFNSKSNAYVNNFIKHIKVNNPKLIEIHNRPSYLIKILKKINNIKFTLTFHNDPRSLKNSKTVEERLYLLNVCEMIYFVSAWVEEKFFEGIEKNYHKNFKIIYPSIEKIKEFPKKENLIIFAGKLNTNKGFDIFCSAIINILNKFKNWKVLAIGDEPREIINFEHRNLKFTGWIPHEKVLEYYKKSSITVVPSKWDEPFGRSALESASRGNAVILSKNGGLPETIAYPIFLKKNDSKNIYDELIKLINNVKTLKKFQKNNFNHPIHLLKNNSSIIDNDRDKIINGYKKININLNKKLKVLNIYNKSEKTSGRIYFISTGKKIENGIIRLGHDVETISDRDILNNNSIFDKKNYLNKLIINKINYYRPDLLLLGHVNSIYSETFNYIKKKHNGLIISQWYEDNLTINGPDFNKNYENLKNNFQFLDNFFISTSPECVSKKVKNINYQFLPTPADKNIEKLSIFKNKSFIYDVFFAMSHGVNRGVIKSDKKDEREYFINKIVEANKNLKFDIYGFNSRQPIWAESFYNTISKSFMAININRGKLKKHSSSNRIASLIGNGLLTFIDEKIKFNDFFSNDEVIFYKNINDLTDKLTFYKNNFTLAKKIAEKGQKKYFKLFNEKEVANYIINRSLKPNNNFKPIWEKINFSK